MDKKINGMLKHFKWLNPTYNVTSMISLSTSYFISNIQISLYNIFKILVWFCK